MNAPRPPVTTLSVPRGMTPNLPDIVEAIGSSTFCAQLLSYLNQLCGADHCAIFRLGNDSVSQVGVGSLDGTNLASRRASRYVTQGYWRKDPAMCEAQDRVRMMEPVIIRVDIGDLVDTDLRDDIYAHMRERLVVAGRRRDSAYGLSMLRADEHGAFSDGDLSRVGSVAEMLVSLLAKHADILLNRPNVALALTSLGEIENCIVATTDLPRREVEVCARMLHGLSTIGIALDLSIGIESVKTYRKRTYQRLGVGSDRELLTWYLALWSAWDGNEVFCPSERRCRPTVN
jgi:DNA-binding NarL/FixJ family response regulator